MDQSTQFSNQRPVMQSILRGAGKRCPRCGHGKLFRSYLKPAADCPRCGEAYGDMRTDDAAPWLTILIVGHIVGPLIVIAERNYQPPVMVSIAIFIPATLLLTLWMLPRAKGALLGLMWALRLRGTEAH